MDDLIFEAPGYMKKEKGTKSKAHVRLSRKGDVVFVDELTYQIGVIKLNAKGTIVQGKTIDAAYRPVSIEEVQFELGDVELPVSHDSDDFQVFAGDFTKRHIACPEGHIAADMGENTLGGY